MSTPAPSSGGGGSESEHDWLFDYIMSVFKAPTWEVPIMTFIDDNCVVFDTDDENKFAYSELHEVRGGLWVPSDDVTAPSRRRETSSVEPFPGT